ncbi:unnamed protein product [Clonostachys chloroleuca]|uniref:Methyl-CpG-binding domain protein 4 n=1 Tax=Clonostachys chloroleuca TaxID=1926264 RepID=A0AA35PXC7_9HYPO|nr:unnamed protein product [Clonostachys chloroleuca]
MGESISHSRQRTGRDLLCVFGDFDEEFADFVFRGVNIQASHHNDYSELFTQSLEAWADDWTALIDCARSMKQSRDVKPESLDGNDLLTFIWEIFRLNRVIAPPDPRPWRETDRLIALAKRLEHWASKSSDEIEPEVRPWQETDRLIAVAKSLELHEDQEANIKSFPERFALHAQVATPRRRVCKATTSHYWLGGSQDRISSVRDATPNVSPPQANLDLSASLSPNLLFPPQGPATQPTVCQASVPGPKASTERRSPIKSSLERRIRANDASPYFTPSESPQKAHTPVRPQAGMVSCVPFPPLTSTCFGLIQEKLAHEPFWLLVAVTFLIRTKGTAAIPVFYAIKERFPTPTDLGDESNATDILDMIRHLGLSTHRLRFLQRYSRAFIEDPPRAGKVYRVKNYDRREEPDFNHGNFAECMDTGMLTPNDDEDDAEAWEIGHMTQGKYAIDSWRIFCRDVLLGRAEDWNGKGREPEFQPEWMRVRPDDKELRACLRWMWMREGWEWDPVTGEKVVLRSVMQNAVNEGRVGYDDVGGLMILDGVL